MHVDEFYIGQPEEQKRGRSKGEKRLVIVELKKVKDGVGMAYAQVIESASSEDLKPFFNNYINVDIVVITDECRGYLPLKKECQHLKQIPSNQGKNFPDMQIHIMNLKGWLRGIHHHYSKEHLQGYFNEYYYRYNKRNSMNTMFDLLVKKMINNKPFR